MISAKVFIATPTANGLMGAEYVRSLAGTISHLAEAGIRTTFRSIDGPNVGLQRDMLARDFLLSDCTHLLFVDSDMLFAPDLCATLLALRLPLVGAVYPRRALDLDRVEALLARHPFRDALALALDWNLHAIDGSITVTNGVAAVDALGTGFLLIERACLDEMVARVPVPEYLAPDGRTRLRAFFRDLAEGDAVWSHDYAFCRLWRQAGGTVHAYAPANLRHVGDFPYGMPFTAYLSALRAGGNG